MTNLLTSTEKKLLKNLEDMGQEFIEKNAFLWCYLDGKRNGYKTFDEQINENFKQNQ